MADMTTIANVLTEIAVAYPKFMADAETREETIKVWAIYLADIDDDLLVVAVRKFISSSTHPFAPSIPEIRKTATELRMEINCIPSAYEAWDELQRAPKPSPLRPFRDGKFHDHEEYQWSHQLVETIARRLGWPHRFPDPDSLMADRSHFIKAYEYEIQKIAKEETRIRLVDEYVAREKNLVLAERSSVFETGERDQVRKQMRALARRME